ncbi:MAG: hypothetical protein HUK22_02265, partial [Thermoguttaceae bacterium]|nr:hypothetical protein [Thermoguttaceae bacterium]
MNRKLSILCALIALFGVVSAVQAAAPSAKITGDWTVEVQAGDKSGSFEIAPPTWLEVKGEELRNLQLFNPAAALWMKGRALRGVNACECTVFGALDPASVVARLENGEKLERGKDFEYDDVAGSIGRLAGGKIGENSVFYVDYRCVKSRIDSIIEDENGELTLIQGEPIVLSPVPPTLKSGQKRLVNVYVTGRIEKLDASALFPVDSAFAENDPADAKAFCDGVARYNAENGVPAAPDFANVGAAKKYLPKTWAKLQSGEKLHILAWGDSVTACGFLPDSQRWQVKFVERLEKMFPN